MKNDYLPHRGNSVLAEQIQSMNKIVDGLVTYNLAQTIQSSLYRAPGKNHYYFLLVTDASAGHSSPQYGREPKGFYRFSVRFRKSGLSAFEIVASVAVT